MPINMQIEYPKLEQENQELRFENAKLKEHKIELLKLLKWISRVTNNPEIGVRCDKATSKYKQYT